MTDRTPEIKIPADLLPADGRFGSGPSKVRPAQTAALAAVTTTLLGTSHRQAPVRELVGSVRARLAELFGLPSEWTVLLGNGGTTTFWDAAAFGLVARRSLHQTFGEFSSKFAVVTAAAPHLEQPVVVESTPGTAPLAPHAEPSVDAYCLTHNETSTGVAVELRRPDTDSDHLVLVDATSAAGAIAWDTAQVDVYYFAPQKCFASDGGLWLAACAPRAVERIEHLCVDGDRWMPASLDLGIALENSRKNQTYNTPALATLVMLDEQLGWMLDGGGLDWTAARSARSSGALYRWAEHHPLASPFVTDPARRSPVVATIDLDDSIPAPTVSRVLRDNGIVDTDSYRKLGRNQLRIATFPAIEPDDVDALVTCLDYVIERLA